MYAKLVANQIVSRSFRIPNRSRLRIRFHIPRHGSIPSGPHAPRHAVHGDNPDEMGDEGRGESEHLHGLPIGGDGGFVWNVKVAEVILHRNGFGHVEGVALEQAADEEFVARSAGVVPIRRPILSILGQIQPTRLPRIDVGGGGGVPTEGGFDVICILSEAADEIDEIFIERAGPGERRRGISRDRCLILVLEDGE